MTERGTQPREQQSDPGEGKTRDTRARGVRLLSARRRPENTPGASWVGFRAPTSPLSVPLCASPCLSSLSCLPPPSSSTPQHPWFAFPLTRAVASPLLPPPIPLTCWASSLSVPCLESCKTGETLLLLSLLRRLKNFLHSARVPGRSEGRGLLESLGEVFEAAIDAHAVPDQVEFRKSHHAAFLEIPRNVGRPRVV